MDLGWILRSGQPLCNSSFATINALSVQCLEGVVKKYNVRCIILDNLAAILRTERPLAIASEHYLLVKLAHAHPYSSQAELTGAFRVDKGISAHPDTFAKALKQAGVTRVKQRFKGSFQSPEPRKSYGYNETQRRQLPEQRYPSCLTDAGEGRMIWRIEAFGR